MNRLSRFRTKLAGLLALTTVFLSTVRSDGLRGGYRFARDAHGFTNMGNVTTLVGVIVGTILAAVVGLVLVAALLPTYSGSVGSIAENFTTADWGDDTANAISPVFAIVVAIAGLLAILGLVFLAVKMKKSG